MPHLDVLLDLLKHEAVGDNDRDKEKGSQAVLWEGECYNAFISL